MNTAKSVTHNDRLVGVTVWGDDGTAVYIPVAHLPRVLSELQALDALASREKAGLSGHAPLRPCPFCGGAADDMGPGGGYDEWIVCGDCLAAGPVATIGCREGEEEDVDLPAEAAILWNTRK